MLYCWLMFQKFKNSSLKNCGLCASHYLSLPALSLNAMFNMEKTELERISDTEMYVSLRKVQQVEFLTFLKDIAKPAKPGFKIS